MNAELTPLMRARIETLRATLDESDREKQAACKIAKHMRDQGMDPATGYVLIFPIESALAAGINIAALPPYVRISYVLTKPQVVLNATEFDIQALCGKPPANGG